MATLTAKQAITIVNYRDHVASFAASCVGLWGTTIVSETDQFDAIRENDSEYWARLTMIKAILSPGCNLDKNISAAHLIHAAMMNGLTAPTFDDIKEILAQCSYGCACYGNNVRSLIGSWETIRHANEHTMTWDALTALCEAKVLFGMGMKVRSWALALYDAKSQVITLDRHMIRGIATLCGIDLPAGDVSLGEVAYVILRELLLSIADDLGCNPLTMQWAMWNELRHVGKHASHIALAD